MAGLSEHSRRCATGLFWRIFPRWISIYPRLRGVTDAEVRMAHDARCLKPEQPFIMGPLQQGLAQGQGRETAAADNRSRPPRRRNRNQRQFFHLYLRKTGGG